MRLRVVSSMSSASSSSRASSRSRSVASGSAIRPNARASRSAAWAASSLDRKHVAFHRAAAPAPGLGAGGAGQHLAADQPQERLGRVGPGGFDAVELRASSCMRLAQSDGGSALAACNAASSGASRSGRSATSSSSRLLQAAGAGPAALGAAQPAAQFGGLRPGQGGGERAVGGVEDVVAFVEHVAGRHRVVVQPAPGRLGHHQRVVGHHQFGGARPADRVLDEAAAAVRAGARGCTRRGGPPARRSARRRTIPAASRAGRRPARRRHRVAIAQRAIRPSGMTCWFMKPLEAVLTASSRFSRHR